MKYLTEFFDFINNDINENDMLSEYLKEEYLNEDFSSEFYNLENINESKKLYDTALWKEYRKIKPLLKEGKQYKKDTKRYFELQKEYMSKVLEEDKVNIKYMSDLLIEKLNLLNEGSRDYTLNEMRNNKIKLIDNYKKKLNRQINKDLKEMEAFFDSNPKILLV